MQPPPEISTPEEWCDLLDYYAQHVASLVLREQRLLRASLDGSWCRLQDEHRDQMVAALEGANERLAPEYKLGFVVTTTGEWFGVPRTTAPLQPAPQARG